MHVNKFYDAKNQERNNSLAVKNREFQICKEGAEKSLDVDLT